MTRRMCKGEQLSGDLYCFLQGQEKYLQVFLVKNLKTQFKGVEGYNVSEHSVGKISRVSAVS